MKDLIILLLPLAVGLAAGALLATLALGRKRDECCGCCYDEDDQDRAAETRADYFRAIVVSLIEMDAHRGGEFTERREPEEYVERARAICQAVEREVLTIYGVPHPGADDGFDPDKTDEYD